MGKVGIKGGNAPASMPKPRQEASFVLGSRPSVVRDPFGRSGGGPTIKPVQGNRDYGKAPKPVGFSTDGMN